MARGRLVPHSWCLECYQAYYRAGHYKRKEANNRRSTEWQKANPEKAQKASNAWRNRNREELRASQRQKYWENPEQSRAQRRAEYWKDPEKSRALARAWGKANPEKIAQNNRNTRAQRKLAAGKHTQTDIDAIFALQRGRCAYCRRSIRNGYHVDHIVPLSKGGSNSRRNLQLTCAACNMSKKDRDPIRHAQRLGRLL
jgi:5-methylcytosine-specific restriction endonuclease McrA